MHNDYNLELSLNCNTTRL